MKKIAKATLINWLTSIRISRRVVGPKVMEYHLVDLDVQKSTSPEPRNSQETGCPISIFRVCQP
jgi:hypothetical protein